MSNKIMFQILFLIISSSLADEATDLRVEQNSAQIFGVPETNKDGNETATVQKNMESSFGSTKVNIESRAGFNELPTPESKEPCERFDKSAGVCTFYNHCEPETSRLQTPGLIDHTLPQCDSVLEVCCRFEDVDIPLPTTKRTNNRRCGYSNFDQENDTSIIKNDTHAQFLEFPWMVAILRRSQPGVAWAQSDYLGGGSLIHPTVVLTAAHKIGNHTAGEVICRAGEWDTQTESELYREQDQNVKKMVIHEHYDRTSILNNIALLILEQPYKQAPNIGYACLGQSLPPAGTRCWSMGWGKDNFKSLDTNSVILKKVELPLVSKTSCENVLRKYTRLGSVFELHQSLMCAGGEEGRDTCEGDGGSSLVCSIGDPKELRYAVYGMVAYGLGCGDRNIPAVYVNIPVFYTWIEDKMKAEGYSTDVFTF